MISAEGTLFSTDDDLELFKDETFLGVTVSVGGVAEESLVEKNFPLFSEETGVLGFTLFSLVKILAT